MSSQPFEASPSTQTSPRSARRRKSRFTYKQLSQLASYSTACPLRVIAHLDLDCFYAQCEMVRLGVPEDQPLAVQQWQALIAINYPARKYGLSRMVTISEARKACPEIIIQHVATWREGDVRWAYHEDAYKHMDTHKASLDPYRLESRKILALIKELLPAPPLQRVEKAGIDEVFIDLSAHIHAQLLERYPQLSGPPPYDDPTEKLPAPPSTALDWNADALVDLDDDQNEEDDPDWDDVAMLIGSEIVRGVRAGIRERLKYTAAAGLARNKMLAKLGSAHKKPNQQTIVRNRAVQHFLADFKFTKIRMLGGKLGDEIVSTFNTDSVKELLEFPLDQLKAKLGDDTGLWLYDTIRGEDHSEVKTRTQIKSMLSAKSFQPSINTFEQAVKWLRIFVADIYARLVEEGVTENKRRPKTINLHHRQARQSRSKQMPIPLGKTIDESTLFDLAKTLLAQVIVDGRAWPCSNLSLTVGGFEDGVTGNKGIGGFLLRGDEAKALQPSNAAPQTADHLETDADMAGPPPKQRRVEETKRINQFFTRREQPRDIAEFTEVPSAQGDTPGATGSEDEQQLPVLQERKLEPVQPLFASEDGTSSPPAEASNDRLSDDRNADRDKMMNESYEHKRYTHEERMSTDSHELDEARDLSAGHGLSRQKDQKITTFFCPRCNKSLLADQRTEHEDFHFAQDLHNQDADAEQQQPRQAPAAAKKLKRKSRTHVDKAGGKTVEKGQKTLNFMS